jgi:hypothetical protein
MPSRKTFDAGICKIVKGDWYTAGRSTDMKETVSSSTIVMAVLLLLLVLVEIPDSIS